MFVITVATGQRAFSVQSSFRLNLSPHLIIKAANIKLIETIGQGEYYYCTHCLNISVPVMCDGFIMPCIYVIIIMFLGEFGVVYKGHIVKDLGRTVTEIVAIKTLKGLCHLNATTMIVLYPRRKIMSLNIES